MVAIYLTTCSWILSNALVGVPLEQVGLEARLKARSAFRWTFGIAFVLLLIGGHGGDTGRQVFDHLNWYLFESVAGAEWKPLVARWSPVTLFAAATTSLAFAIFVFLGTLCNGLVKAAFPSSSSMQGADALGVAELGRRLMQFMVFASSLMVTSTLTIFLLFSTADQIDALRTTGSSFAAPPTQSLTCLAKARAPSTAGPAPTLKSQPSHAAYVAMGAGIAFSGVLFILFMSASSAFDDRTADLLRTAFDVSQAGGEPFNVKTWREAHGFDAPSPVDQVLKALALLAPAFAGLLTMTK